MNDFIEFIDSVDSEVGIVPRLRETTLQFYNNLSKEEQELFFNFAKCCYDAGWSVAYG
jgi:hypothetical protein